MAKKGGAVQLQIEVDNEEDWNKLVRREGLIVVDVYSDWCGPCTGMLGNLRKLKLEIGGDTLTLATAKSDSIPCLDRFRNKSEPTWMFIAGGKMLRLMFGANAPRLVNIITEELVRERKAMAEKTPREGIQFDQLTDEEQERVDGETRIAEEAARVEREHRERTVNERREAVVTNLVDYVHEYSFVLLWPHVTNDGVAQVFDALKDTELTVAGKPAKLQLTSDQIFELMYYSPWEYTEDALGELAQAEGTALLFQAPLIDFEGDTVDIVLQKVYGSMRGPPGDEECLAQRLLAVVEKELVAEEQEEEEAPEEAEKVQCEIPGVFVAQNEKVKAAALRILFPLVTQKFDLAEPEPVPPHLLVAFDAFKKTEVFQLTADYPTETMHLGFFSSSDPDTAKLIAKTVDQYDKIPVPPYDGKLILQVSRKHSEPLLSFSLLGPTYVSPNTVVGGQECAQFFPEDYEEPEPEVVEEVKKKHKKRGRGSKASVTSGSSSKVSVESSEEPTAPSDEGLEEVQEEEGLEEEEEEEEEEAADDLTADDVFDFDGMQQLDDATPPAAVDEGAAEADKATSPMDNAPEE